MLKLEYTTQLLKTDKTLNNPFDDIQTLPDFKVVPNTHRKKHINTPSKPPFALKSDQTPVQKTFSVFQLVLHSVLLYRLVVSLVPVAG